VKSVDQSNKTEVDSKIETNSEESKEINTPLIIFEEAEEEQQPFLTKKESEVRKLEDDKKFKESINGKA